MRILIADDHEVVLEGLKVLLQRLGSEVTVVACGDLADALEVAAKGDSSTSSSRTFTCRASTGS